MVRWDDLKQTLFSFFKRRSPVGAGRTHVDWEAIRSDSRKAKEDALKEPLLAGKYHLDHVIGRGGMGKVWKAREADGGKRVAIKEMRKGVGALDSDIRVTFLKEAHVLTGLRHRNIVELIEVLDRDEGVYLVFEFLRGKTLQQLIAEMQRIPWDDMRHVVRAAARGLDFAHEKGIVHRDIKPSNIMVSSDGFTKIMDFGISRISGQPEPVEGGPMARPGGRPIPVSRTPNVVGTPAYRAPEASLGIVSPSADVFSLGVSLYESLTGELPFGPEGCPAGKDGCSPSAGDRVPGLPAAVDQLLVRMMEPDYEKRIPSMAELRAAFRALT